MASRALSNRSSCTSISLQLRSSQLLRAAKSFRATAGTCADPLRTQSAMSSIRPSSSVAGLEVPTLDLKLLCANGESVLVCSKLLRSATRSAAIEDIIDLDQTASAERPMELPVPADSAAVWRIVWNIIEHPMSKRRLGLDWGNIEQVIQLADKYALLSVLQACELFIVTALVKQPTVTESEGSKPFGSLGVQPTPVSLRLPFLELLCRVEMWNALEGLGGQFLRLLHNTCLSLKIQRRVLTCMLMGQPASLSDRESQSDHERRLAVEVNQRIQAMNAALESFRDSSGDSEAAARIVGFIHEQMALVMSELMTVSIC